MTQVSISKAITAAYIVKLDFDATIIGMQPSDSVAADWVREKSIKARAAELVRFDSLKPEAARMEATRQVNETMGVTMTVEEEAESALKMTVFPRDTLGVHFWDYQLRGFFREAARALDMQVSGKKAANVQAEYFVRKGLWVKPADKRHGRKLYLLRDGEFIPEADDVEERIKRVKDPRGIETNVIAVSEVVHPPAEMRFKVLLTNRCRLTRDHLEEMLAYVGFNGIGQWRSGGFGTATADLTEIKASEVDA